jgi:hypothetical protein
MGFLDSLEKFGANTLYIVAFFGLVLLVSVFLLFDIQTTKTFQYIFTTAPIWLPVITFYLFFEYWMLYVQKDYNLQQGRVTLEIKLPQDIFKSPEAMELVLIQLYQTASPDNHLQTYIDGKNPPTHGLEIVSRGGDVRFYINTQRKKFKNMAETHLYAQYPGIEVHELDIDYTAEVPWDPDRFDYFSVHFGLKKADAYPIKTYIDYGLDKLPKEEEKIDPLTTMLEILGSIGPGEYAWIQILITANREVTFKEGSLGTVPDWKGEARDEIQKIIKEANKRVGIDPEKNENQTLTMMNLSDGEKDTIKAIERSISKIAFNTAIRTLYIGKKGSFFPGERIGAFITGWRSYDDQNRNSIGFRWRTDFDWNIWQDPSGAIRKAYKEQELDEYKRRAYTYHSHADTPKVMTVEELATIFHLPGRVAMTPSLGRIPSKRGEAPPNLPIGTV